MELPPLPFAGNISDNEELQACVFPYDFPLPRAEPTMDFYQCFKSTIYVSESGEAVSNLDRLRRNIVDALAIPANLNLESVIGLIDEYIPMVYRLLDSLNHQPPVKMDKASNFEWKGCMDWVVSKYPEFVFELVMLLHAKAFLHYRLGNSQVMSLDTISQAGQNYLLAANVMEYLGSSLLGQWVVQPGAKPRPLSANIGFSRAMAHFFQASAQTCATVKLMCKPGDPPPMGMIAKVALPVVLDYTHCSNCLVSLGPEIFATIDPDFIYHISYKRELFNGVCTFYQAKAYEITAECGLAIGYFRRSKTYFREQAATVPGIHNQTSNGIPCLQRKLVPVKNGIAKWRLRLNHEEEKALRDNKLIYYAAVPADAELPELPPGVLIMNRKAYERPPQTSHIISFQPPPPVATTGTGTPSPGGIFPTATSPPPAVPLGNPSPPTSLFNPFGLFRSTSYGSTGVVPGSVSSPRPRSDSDIARELQAKIDAGQDV